MQINSQKLKICDMIKIILIDDISHLKTTNKKLVLKTNKKFINIKLF